MEKEEKFMETIKAVVEVVDEKYFISIDLEDGVKIPLSEDKPNEVKSAFNYLIHRIKDGPFQIEFEGLGADLFTQVASEYIKQLNRELMEVFGEMEGYGLIEA